MTNEEIYKCNICDYIPTKLKKAKDHKQSTHKYELWNFPDVMPAKHVVKKLFAESLAIACKQIMNNHVYEFANNIHVQQNEGSIGVMFTGIVAEIKMLKWCIEFKTKLKDLKIKNYLQPRLVDDITLLPEVIKPGMRFENDTLVYHKDKEDEDNLMADDIRTMKIIQTVANTIDENISVSFDVPSMNEDNRVPVLDVKMCVNSNIQVEYTFYKKQIIC